MKKEWWTVQRCVKVLKVAFWVNLAMVALNVIVFLVDKHWWHVGLAALALVTAWVAYKVVEWTNRNVVGQETHA